MIYSSGRESYFNLNSTWYDPSGSWLDTRRTPFRYAYNTCCSSGCDGEGGEGASCVRRPTYSYGSSGGCNSYGRSVCAERCHGSSGSCHGGGSSCVRRPTYSYGSSGGCHSYGRSVCSETCHGSGYQGGKPCSGKPTQSVPQCCPPQTCCPPVQQQGGASVGYGRSVCSETCHGSGYQGGKPCSGKPTQSVSQCCPPQTYCPPVQQQSSVPVAKCIPSQQQKQVCKMPARKIK
ncbi:PREDICTED: keratin, ultra high-sulfur matrix protein-like [Apaloderma vittatum]|uniref:keratin, ultra high-sulfur matrix protein-like n=1 Tax=Apaloderma vittatum TaxID=57397 RepID=UPI0005216951|nr:PREDICTED: keratin, ultra high-sulfur matrix protein-like [Apaloderma vittatum]